MRWCVCLLFAACAGHAVAPSSPSSPTVTDHVEDVADHDDRCPYLPPECVEGYDPHEGEDGCPDSSPLVVAMIVLPVGASEIPADGLRLLEGIAAETRTLIAGAHLVISIEAAPGEPEGETARRTSLVFRALAERGVSAERVRGEPDGPVAFEGSDPAPDHVVLRVEGCTRR